MITSKKVNFGESENHIFMCEKNTVTGWYKIEGDNKIWDERKLKEFWQKIRDEKMANNDFNFQNFIFPKCEAGEILKSKNEKWGDILVAETDYSFWKRRERVVFPRKAYFKDAVFSGEVDFHQVIFSGEAEFSGATFSERADFYDTTFLGKAYFDKTTFLKEARFVGATFSKEVDFNESIFSQDVSFLSATFFGRSSFSDLTFLSKVNFSEITFSPKTILFFNDFKIGEKGQVSYEFIQPKTEKQDDACVVVFSGDLPVSTIFRDVHLGRTFFGHTRIKTTQFFECDWYKFKGRNCIYDEIKLDAMSTTKDYEAVESSYRQLKHQFENISHWQSAGDFHIGEMEMRRKKLVKEKGGWRECPEIFLLSLYKLISDYGERVGRAFAWIVVLVVVGAILLMWLADRSPGEAILGSLQAVSFQQDIIKEGAPIVEGYIVVVLRMFSPVFLGFFLIAVRRKFKR